MTESAIVTDHGHRAVRHALEGDQQHMAGDGRVNIVARLSAGQADNNENAAWQQLHAGDGSLGDVEP